MAFCLAPAIVMGVTYYRLIHVPLRQFKALPNNRFAGNSGGSGRTILKNKESRGRKRICESDWRRNGVRPAFEEVGEAVPIYRFLKDSAFGPEDIKAIVTAYERAC
jgi:hypothetical protein